MPDGEDEKALECMRRAAEGTSFLHEPLFPDRPDEPITIYQSWSTVERQERQQAEQLAGG